MIKQNVKTIKVNKSVSFYDLLSAETASVSSLPSSTTAIITAITTVIITTAHIHGLTVSQILF